MGNTTKWKESHIKNCISYINCYYFTVSSSYKSVTTFNLHSNDKQSWLKTRDVNGRFSANSEEVMYCPATAPAFFLGTTHISIS